MRKYVFVLILLLAIFLRFNNLNWDNNFHLHPDERFLTMVGNSLKIPKSTLDYFNTSKSTLNPANVGYKFFVYGTFPLTLNKLIAVGLSNDNYNDFTIQGRFLSALFDLLTVIVIYKIAKLLIPKKNKGNLPLWSAFFYAIAVYPIQSSHFFTTDSFQIFFSLLAVYLVMRSKYILSVFFFGLAIASKISAVYIFPLILAFIFFNNRNIKKIFFLTTIYLLLTTFVIFLADPKFFTPAFFDSLRQLQTLSVREAWYPPLVQWLSKTPVVFSLFNLAFIGVGLLYFILVIVGMIWIISNIPYRVNKYQISKLKIILIWVVLFFLYQSSQLVQSIRYLYILFPFLAIFAAVGITQIKNYKIQIIVLLLSLIWPIMFSTIYFHKHTRVEASEWIYSKLESGSLILGEYWDDALPLSIPNNSDKTFQIELLPVFDQDTSEKWKKMNGLLNTADYYILSSNRGWGSIPTVPERYPKMSKFYNDLLAGKLNYKKIKEFKPYYYRFFELSSAWVDESFTVYDHPTVMIFARQKK